MKQARAFVLIELLVTMAVIAILGAVITPKIASVVSKSKSAQCISNRTSVEQAEARYRIDHDNTPSASVAVLKSASYLDRVPVCSAGGYYVWISTTDPSVGCSVHYWPFDPGSVAASLFTSQFNSMDKLKVLMGNWAIVGDVLKGWSGESRLAFGDNSWTDYNLTLNATLTKGSGYGVYYRADGKANITGYCFQYDPGYPGFLVRKVVNGVESGPIGRTAIPPGFATYNTQHQIQIRVVGNTQNIYVDGAKVMTLTDSTFSSGSAGLRTWDSTQALFDSVNVTAP